MNFGAEFDDEIFEKPKTKNCKSTSIRKGAKICEPKWFLEENTVDGDDAEETLKCLKYRADYLYFLKDYSKACVIYDKYMTILPESNVTGRRECMENLARCYLHQNLPEKALEWALKMHAVAISGDQKLSSWNLLAKICHKLKKYEEELESLHCCLETHKSFPDFWMRLAYCYSGLFKIYLPGSDCLDITNDTYCCAFKSRISVPNGTITNSSIKHMCHAINGLVLNNCNMPSPSSELPLDQNQSSRFCDSSMCSSSKSVSDISWIPNSESVCKQANDMNVLKCEMCTLATQVISACLIRTRILLTNTDNCLHELKNSAMNKKITDCLNHLEIDQLFIEEATKMLKNEMYAGNVQTESLVDELLCSGVTKAAETTDNEKTYKTF